MKQFLLLISLLMISPAPAHAKWTEDMVVLACGLAVAAVMVVPAVMESRKNRGGILDDSGPRYYAPAPVHSAPPPSYRRPSSYSRPSYSPPPSSEPDSRYQSGSYDYTRPIPGGYSRNFRYTTPNGSVEGYESQQSSSSYDR